MSKKEKRLPSTSNRKEKDAKINMARIDKKLPSLLLFGTTEVTTKKNSKGPRTNWNTLFRLSYSQAKIKKNPVTRELYNTKMANWQRDLEDMAEFFNTYKKFL